MAEYKSSNSAVDFNKQKEDAFKQLEEIDKKYSLETYTPNEITSLGLEKKEFQEPTEDEIKSQAESALFDESENEKQKIENSYLNKFSKLDAEIEDAGTDKDESIEKALENYNSSLRKTTNNSIKQGISRSSIFDEAVKAIEGTKNTEIDSAIGEFNKKIEQLEGERSILEMQKQNALEGFDISYAVKLENKISKIASEISKQKKEVENYNKQIEEQEKAHVAAQEKENLEEQKRVESHNNSILKQKEKLGERGFLDLILSERYESLLNYLNSIPKDVALEQLETDKRFEQLLSTYYPAVYSQISNRKE